MLRRTRIALSAIIFLAAMLLACLFARSVSTKDNVWIRLGDEKSLRVISTSGLISVSIRKAAFQSSLAYTRSPAITLTYEDSFGNRPSVWWFQILRWNSGYKEYQVPIWIPIGGFLTLAVALSPTRNFSLKALIIAFVVLSALLAVAASWHGEYEPPRNSF